MKVTLYNMDGSVNREFECVSWRSHCGDFNMFVITNTPETEIEIDDFVVSNLPFVVETQTIESHNERDWMRPNRITLVSDRGEGIRVWESVKDVSYRGNVITFKAGDDYVSVFGNVVMTPESKGHGL